MYLNINLSLQMNLTLWKNMSVNFIGKNDQIIKIAIRKINKYQYYKHFSLITPNYYQLQCLQITP